jgi:hypothetical protein
MVPPADTKRWVASRKAAVVASVNGGWLTAREACERYEMDLEELASWQRAVDRGGLSGLKAASVQENRKALTT